MKKIVSVLLAVVLIFSSFSFICSAEEMPQPIDRQYDSSVRDIPWGSKGNTGANGCGWISVYNVLVHCSTNVTKEKVIADLTEYNAPFVFGLLGANPFAMTRYLKSKFNNVSMNIFGSKNWPDKSQDKDGVIVLYQAKGIFSSLHYVAGLFSGEKNENGESTYFFYNTGKVFCDEAISVSDYLTILKNDGCKLFVFFTAESKQGEW